MVYVIVIGNSMQCSLVYSFWLLASNCRKKSVSLGMRLTNVHTSPNPLNLLSTVSHGTLSGGAPTGAEFHKIPAAASVEQIRTSNEERRGKILILSSGHNSGIIGLYMLTRTRLAIRKVHDGNVELRMIFIVVIISRGQPHPEYQTNFGTRECDFVPLLVCGRVITLTGDELHNGSRGGLLVDREHTQVKKSLSLRGLWVSLIWL